MEPGRTHQLILTVFVIVGGVAVPTRIRGTHSRHASPATTIDLNGMHAESPVMPSPV